MLLCVARRNIAVSRLVVAALAFVRHQHLFCLCRASPRSGSCFVLRSRLYILLLRFRRNISSNAAVIMCRTVAPVLVLVAAFAYFEVSDAMLSAITLRRRRCF